MRPPFANKKRAQRYIDEEVTGSVVGCGEGKYRKRRRLSFKNKLRSTWFELYPPENCAREGNGKIQRTRISQSFQCNEERTSYFMDGLETLLISGV